MTEKEEKTSISRKQANPVYASVSTSPHEEKEGDREEWNKKFLKLPRFMRYGLISSETEEKIIQLANRFGLRNAIGLGKISRLIRDVFLGKVKSKQIKKEIEKRLNLDQERINAFEKEFKAILGFIVKNGKDLAREDLEKGDIKTLMQKYEEIKNQEVGGNFLEIEGEGETLSPTIENWIYDYKSKVGTGNKNLLQESGYVYNSTNAKELNKKNKEKLSLIIKSYVNGKKIFYNKLYKEIDFEVSLDPEKVLGIKGGLESGNSNIKNFKSSPYFDIDYQDKGVGKRDFNKGDFSQEKDMKKSERSNAKMDLLGESAPAQKESENEDKKNEANTLNLNDYI
ncbi:MAG: hypothetical protein R6V40_01830 [Candidatus Moraniibacteriota bacterium]